MRKKNKQPGFTLIEIIVVISILAIIGLLASRIIGRSMEAYSALDRREELQTSLRFTVERILRELRNSLPNSLCVYDGTGCSSEPQSKFYFIPIKTSGRYQENGAGIREELRTTLNTAASQFDVLSASPNFPLNASTGDWVSVYNINNTDIYAGTNNVAHQISNVTLVDYSGVNVERITFSAPQYFANGSPTRRFHIIADDTVTLFYYDAAAKKIYRDTTTFAAPHTPSGNPRLFIENVEACTFTYVTGSQQRAGLLRINITVENKGERIQIIQEDHEYNIP